MRRESQLIRLRHLYLILCSIYDKFAASLDWIWQSANSRWTRWNSDISRRGYWVLVTVNRRLLAFLLKKLRIRYKSFKICSLWWWLNAISNLIHSSISVLNGFRIYWDGFNFCIFYSNWRGLLSNLDFIFRFVKFSMVKTLFR